MPSLALLKVLEKNLDDENIGCDIFVDLQKHLTLLNIIFFYQNLNIVMCVVLVMNG